VPSHPPSGYPIESPPPRELDLQNTPLSYLTSCPPGVAISYLAFPPSLPLLGYPSLLPGKGICLECSSFPPYSQLAFLFLAYLPLTNLPSSSYTPILSPPREQYLSWPNLCYSLSSNGGSLAGCLAYPRVQSRVGA
jgi:hypothetical protein